MTIMKTILLLFFRGDGSFLVFDFIFILTGIGQRGDFDQKRLRIGVAGRWWAPSLTADEPPHNAWHISQILENNLGFLKIIKKILKLTSSYFLFLFIIVSAVKKELPEL